MANQTLAEFTEKLFVADADHTFIWDTVGAISKRVSRNSWLNSGTLTSDAPVTISQTWGNNLVTFTGLKFNAAGTSDANSASGSLLADFQVNGVTKANIRKNGLIYSGFVFTSPIGFNISSNSDGSNQGAAFSLSGIAIPSGATIGFTSGNGSAFASPDTILLRDGAPNTLALRNGAAAQTFRVYNTYSNGGIDYERASFNWASNVFRISTEKLGGGSDRGMEINAGVYLNINIGGSLKFGMGGAGTSIYTPLGFGPDNTHDIGASGASRPRNVYVGSDVIASNNVGAGAGGYLNWFGRSIMGSPSNGVISLLNNAGADFNRLQFGGTTNLFPAIKRSSTTLQARLADDSAFAPIQGKLTTDTAYTGTVVAATGYITIYDSTGAAYRVPCAL